jgi:uncharacterized RDD family membrane protein YckC
LRAHLQWHHEQHFLGLFRMASHPAQRTTHVNIKPTPITAAAAGAFSALAWPFLWSHFGNPATSGSLELIVGTLLLVALPAHAFVLGFKRTEAVNPRAVDTALLKRIGSWLAAGAATVVLAAAVRA